MSQLFDNLVTGLNQDIDYSQCKGQAQVVTLARYSIDPVKKYDRKQIRTIRMNANMTQAVFADFLGVSIKTVKARERGRTHPNGPACKLLSLISLGQFSSLPFIRQVA